MQQYVQSGKTLVLSWKTVVDFFLRISYKQTRYRGAFYLEDSR